MIEVGRKTDAGDFFGGAVGAGIPTVAEGIKEKFPGIGMGLPLLWWLKA